LLLPARVADAGRDQCDQCDEREREETPHVFSLFLDVPALGGAHVHPDPLRRPQPGAGREV